MKSPQEIIKEISKDDLFKQWQQEHPRSFLSHYFAPLNTDFSFKTEWEVGYYADNKITVFIPHEKGFEIKPADDIFKKKEAKVEELSLNEVRITFEQALETFKENLPKYFPNEILGEGFVILQKYQGKTLWNFTFVTKKIKFINLKIDAVSGKISEHQDINLVEK